MKKTIRQKTFILAFLIAGATSMTNIVAEDRKPNILLIYADDLGSGMLGCYGQKDIETPNIDKLAEQGVKFTSFYGCNVCAPARASLISGLHTGHAMQSTPGGLESSLHIGKINQSEFEKKILERRPVSNIDSDYIGKVAKRAGYKTSYFGKLGVGFTDTPKMMQDYGFDYYCGLLDSVICWSFYPEYYWETGKKIPIPGNPKMKKRNPKCFAIGDPKMTYSEDIWLDKALEYIEKHKNESFFMVYASQLPHGPVSIAPKDYKYKDKSSWTENERLFASMIHKLDSSVGALMNKLDEAGIAENTIIIFTGDNGHEPGYYRPKEDRKRYSHNTWNGLNIDWQDRFDGTLGKRGTKRFSFDGGINVPFIATWPGKIKKGSVCDYRAVVYDIMPTIAELGNVTIAHKIDGISFLPTLLGKPIEQKRHNYLFWAGNNAYTRDAIIVDDWKLVEEKQEGSTKENYDYNWGLYNLKDDPLEKENVSDKFPERVKAMLKLVEEAKQPLNRKGE